MVAYSCNISCAGCISVSDIKRPGIEPFQSLVDGINKWKNILNPMIITVFGGEPCLHPKLQEICAELRQAWPTSLIRLITNGYLLDNFDSSVWFDFEPFDFQISIHRKDHESVINEKIKNILKNRKSWVVTTQGGARTHQQITWTHNRMTVYKSIFETFITPYKKSQDKFLPWHGDAKEAHSICGASGTPILYKGLLYKCPAVANIIDVTGENWFNYQAVDVDGEVETFVNNIGVPESVCAQCPDLSQKQFAAINHFDKENVIVKHKNLN